MDMDLDLFGIKQENNAVTSQMDFSDILPDIPEDISVPNDSNDLSFFERRRGRKTFTFQQIQELEKLFKQNQYVSAVDLEQMSTRLQVMPKQVKVWFQNRRVREKSLLVRNQPDGATVQVANPNGISRPAHKLVQNAIRLNLARYCASRNTSFQFRQPLQNQFRQPLQNQFRQPVPRKPVKVYVEPSTEDSNINIRNILKQGITKPVTPNVSKAISSSNSVKSEAAPPIPEGPKLPDFSDVTEFFNRIKTLRELGGNDNIKKENDKEKEAIVIKSIPQPLVSSTVKGTSQLQSSHPYVNDSSEMYSKVYHNKS